MVVTFTATEKAVLLEVFPGHAAMWASTHLMELFGWSGSAHRLKEWFEPVAQAMVREKIIIKEQTLEKTNNEVIVT